MRKLRTSDWLVLQAISVKHALDQALVPFASRADYNLINEIRKADVNCDSPRGALEAGLVPLFAEYALQNCPLLTRKLRKKGEKRVVQLHNVPRFRRSGHTAVRSPDNHPKLVFMTKP